MRMKGRPLFLALSQREREKQFQFSLLQKSDRNGALETATAREKRTHTSRFVRVLVLAPFRGATRRQHRASDVFALHFRRLPAPESETIAAP